ncbi:hypothetical protein, partial [Actinoplanes campanulatus]|uniref:hypothetical protein n=1 Tax=Actinoplanes campanulatus TaxID=113559 RepID=UPI001E302270
TTASSGGRGSPSGPTPQGRGRRSARSRRPAADRQIRGKPRHEPEPAGRTPRRAIAEVLLPDWTSVAVDSPGR